MDENVISPELQAFKTAVYIANDGPLYLLLTHKFGPHELSLEDIAKGMEKYKKV